MSEQNNLQTNQKATKATVENKNPDSLILDFGLWNKTYTIPARILDEHLTLASGSFLKIILFIYKNISIPLTYDVISKNLKLPISEVIDGIKYWQDAGIIPMQKASDTNGINVEDGIKSTFSKGDNDNITIKVKQAVFEEVKFPPRSKPSEALALKENNPEIKDFLLSCEKILSKMLTPTEIVDFIWYNQGLGLNLDIILMLLNYCKKVDKTSLAYISKVAVNWWENDINTHQKARDNIIYLENLNVHQSKIKKTFGIYNRKLTKKEAEYIETWFNVYNYDVPIISLAYDACVNSTGKISFPYINKTLAAWFSAGLITVDEIKEYNKEHDDKKNDEKAKKATPQKNNKTQKFEQSSIDYDQLEDFLNKNI